MEWLQDPIQPMLAKLVDKIPQEDYFYEVKWDGIRAILTYNGKEIRIRTRNKNDVTGQFPELQSPVINAKNGVFDGEIICPDEDGRPSFRRIIKRVRTSDPMKIQRLENSHPVHFYLFDCLYLDDEPLVDQPLWKRKESMSIVIDPDDQYRISKIFKDGERLFQATKEEKLEGILAKKRHSKYQIGQRSNSWQKIKIRHHVDCKIIGYTKGEGDRTHTFGALHVAEITAEGLEYRGKVGTGFSDQMMKDIHDLLMSLQEVDKPIYAPISKNTIWIQPILKANISYNELNPNGTFRAPVFERFKT